MPHRVHIVLTGAVQGVGFRPFVFNLAKNLGLNGYVSNNTQGVMIDIEGSEDKIHEFLILLNEQKPPLSHIFSQEVHDQTEIINYKEFEIRDSSHQGAKEVLILPDVSTCHECYQEMSNPKDRRFNYPFINCTHCGPRFSIIKNLPYDRPHTTMKDFEMCDDCQNEYEDPQNRRFHAQPNACPICGPVLSLYNSENTKLYEKNEALIEVIQLLKKGFIVALKGIGGFHLGCDATNNESLKKLRDKKDRFEKPFAVMFRNLDAVRKYAVLTKQEEALIVSAERPITLVIAKEDTDLSLLTAPHLKKIGVFLPYSPLHFLLLNQLDRPLVMTSANLSDEPIVKDNKEACERLSLFSDYLLTHNRDIKNHVDDSVVRVIGKTPTFIRRSRGYAPLAFKLPFKLNQKVLAVGGHQKNVVALGLNDQVIASQHIGDLETLTACQRFDEVIQNFLNLYDFKPDVIIHDLHPDYYSTKWALSQNVPTQGVQHHYAHALSLMADNQLNKDQEILAITWDGTGYGTDKNLWGGEFLLSNYQNFERLWHFDYFKLIGSEKAVKEPRRVALSLLFHLYDQKALNMENPATTAFSKKEKEILFTAWQKGINSPLSSSVGRLFDAVTALLDIKQVLSYEGQSGMIMEDMYDPCVKDEYPYDISDEKIFWQPLMLALLKDKSDQATKATRFINTLARLAIDLIRRTKMPTGLSGGVFQNKPLVERILELAEKERLQIYTHKRVPPNDGGLFLGQVVLHTSFKL